MAEKNRIRLSVGQKLNRASIKNNTAIITTAAASQDDPKHIIVQGAGGLKGETGPANTLTIGTVESGATADATITGIAPNQTLNLVLPKGDQGPEGPANTLSIGTVEKGDTAGATITGDAPNQTLNLTLPQGSPGAAATIAAGTTTTLSPGSSATVTNSGTSSAAVFDFGIPQGATGSPGADGADGADGFSPIATVTKSGDTATISITDANGTTTASVSDGAAGSPGPANTLSIGTVQSGAIADATITGTSPNQTLNLTLPKGDKGDTGNAATITAGTTTTLPAGSNASVTNSGTSSAAVFDFSIPKGDKGDTGTAATVSVGTTTTLAPGSSATVTNSGTSSAAIFDFGIPKGDPADQPDAYKSASGNPITLTDAGPSIKSINKVLGDTAQTTYTGKNLLVFPYSGGQFSNGITFTDNGDGSVTLNGKNNGNGNSAFYFVNNPDTLTLSAGNYTFSGMTNDIGIVLYDGTNYYNRTINSPLLTLSESKTFTIVYLQVYKNNSTTFDNVTVYPMIESGTTATSYEPYVGGIASPNPDYPQTVHTVSGTQTVTITDGDSDSSAYSVRLGSIELCKIGTYQDYIYKSNGDWFVHKEFEKINLGSLTWNTESSGVNYRLVCQTQYTNLQKPASNNDLPVAICSHYGIATAGDTYSGVQGLSMSQSNRFYVYDNNYNSSSSATAYNTWVQTNNPIAYWQLATPTDTQITDADLISDLEALNSAPLYEGTCDITATATSPNLAGDLELDYWTWFKGEQGPAGPSGSGAWGTITGDIQSQTDLQNEFSTKADISSLATVATSGSYTDLSDKPTIPTVNNATLTIQKNGTDVQTFTANSSTNATANITVPTALSELTGTVSTSQIASEAVTSAKIDKSSIIDIIYPVGSIYTSTNNVSPATFLGGTWTQIQDTFLLAAGSTYTAGDTGGSDSHTHTLENGYAKIVLKAASKIAYQEMPVTPWTDNYTNSTGAGSGSSASQNYAAKLGGNADSSSNMPPYLAVYMWERTA